MYIMHMNMLFCMLSSYLQILTLCQNKIIYIRYSRYAIIYKSTSQQFIKLIVYIKLNA